jgi:hypothetical protein
LAFQERRPKSNDEDLQAASAPVKSVSGVFGNKKTAITVLQFLVGALVTLGGASFATFALSTFGRSLGLAHLSIGVIGIIGGLAALGARPWSWRFLLIINALTVVWSSVSESLVEIDSLLPPSASLDSLIGTIIAIVMSGAIIYLLSRKDPKFIKKST